MAQSFINANLKQPQIPYNFFETGVPVLFQRSSFEQDQERAPEVYYLDNVLPIAEGYSTLGFTEKVPDNPAIQGAKQSFVVHGKDGAIALFIITETQAWVFDPAGGVWTSLDLPAGTLERVTYGTVREVTYIHLGTGLFIYDFSEQKLVQAFTPSLPGIGNTLGVTSAGSQLVLWDQTRLFISSIQDPLDFFPDIATGANTSQIVQLRGEITACVSLGKNFIVYSNLNAVAARATDNLALPYRFTEIAGSAGVLKIEHITWNTNIGAHITWTQSGFQQVTVEQAQYIWPDLSDSIIRALLLRINPIFNIPEIKRVTRLDVNLSLVGNRYIAISVRDSLNEDTPYFYDSYVLDTFLQRWGKLSVPHIAFLEYVVPEIFNPFTYQELRNQFTIYGEMEAGVEGTLSYRDLNPNTQVVVPTGNNLGLVLPSGAVHAISFTETADFRGDSGESIGAAKGRIILGRYKLSRNSGLYTHWVKLNDLYSGELTWISHFYNGKIATIKRISHKNSEQAGQYFGAIAGDSVSLDIVGNFKLTDITIAVSPGGNINQYSSDSFPSFVTSSIKSCEGNKVSAGGGGGQIKLVQQFIQIPFPIQCYTVTEINQFWERGEQFALPGFEFDPAAGFDGAFVYVVYNFIPDPELLITFDSIGFRPTQVTIQGSIPSSAPDFTGKFSIMSQHRSSGEDWEIGRKNFSENPIPSGTDCFMETLDLTWPDNDAFDLHRFILLNDFSYDEIEFHRILFNEPYPN